MKGGIFSHQAVVWALSDPRKFLMIIKQIKQYTMPHDILTQYSSLFKVSIFMNEAHRSLPKCLQRKPINRLISFINQTNIEMY